MRPSAVVDLADLPAVDGHCHPLVAESEEVSSGRFLDLFSEGRAGTMRAHVAQTGYLRRALRGLAEGLGCAPTVEAVLEARRAGGTEAARRRFAASRITALLVDTGYPAGAMSLAEMRRTLPCAVHEVFRIETCAQELLLRGLSYEAFLDAFRAALDAAASHAVALKSIIAYRSGLAVRAWEARDAARAYHDVVARVRAGGSARLTEKPLLDTLFEIALGVCRHSGRPLQVHSGFGDPDVDLLQANPLWLRPILEDARWADVRIVVLHMSYPYAREAAFMAAVWPQVYVDLSLALPFLGPAAALPLAEMLALAPASKLMYGSDVSALPELFALSADWARAALGEALGWLVERGGLTESEAFAVARQVMAESAAALYRLP
jgi:predicted TIM-barrel fold metal-dependent hydrolase